MLFCLPEKSMKQSFSGSTSVQIEATAETVWKFLTDPDLVSLYLHGTNLQTDWKTGSCIVFKGEFEGRSYHDKGVVLAYKPESLVSYSYWSSMSGLADKPENYMVVTFRLQPEQDRKTLLELRMENIPSEQTRNHAINNWKQVLASMKILAEDSGRLAAY